MDDHLSSVDSAHIQMGDSYMPSNHISQSESQEPGSVEVQIATVQRRFQEQTNAQRVNQQNTNKEITTIKSNIVKIEGKLGPLQKMLASLTDRTLGTKKELTDLEKKLKASIDEIKSLIAQNSSEITDLKVKVNDLTRKVNSNQGRPGFSGGNVPENIVEILEPYERQLGMYDVRIAELDSRFQVLESTSYTGTLVWKIRDYDRRRREAISGKTLSLYSQPFYTSRYGYKMCARVYLNGDGMGKGTHMSLFFVVMKGEYDALLPWPFRQKVTLMLLDQGIDRRHLSDTFRPDPTSSSFKRPTSDMNIASGCPLFVAHTVIDGSTYVKEDTIFLRIVVDTTDLENL